jgi:hypothetical protein
MANKPMVLTRKRRPITSVELLDKITGEIGQIVTLVADGQGAFREHSNKDRRMILQILEREPYHITIEDVHGGRFRVDGTA